MRTHTIIIFSILTLLFSCNTPTKKEHNEIIKDTLNLDSSKMEIHYEESKKTIPKNLIPIFGYRFIVSGDFDGDGKKERLVEHYFSALDNKETNKYYDSISDYVDLVDLTVKKEPYSFLLSSNKNIDTLHISSSLQLFGVSYLKNEGDLNGDGTDEISYVIDYADWSNLNTWHVVTYKNKKWIELYSFPIWDWQLPELPEAINQYGLFGFENKIMNTTNDTINKEIEKELKQFKGLLKKIKTNKIQVVFRNEDADKDTMIVDLKKLK